MAYWSLWQFRVMGYNSQLLPGPAPALSKQRRLKDSQDVDLYPTYPYPTTTQRRNDTERTQNVTKNILLSKSMNRKRNRRGDMSVSGQWISILTHSS